MIVGSGSSTRGGFLPVTRRLSGCGSGGGGVGVVVIVGDGLAFALGFGTGGGIPGTPPGGILEVSFLEPGAYLQPCFLV